MSRQQKQQQLRRSRCLQIFLQTTIHTKITSIQLPTHLYLYASIYILRTSVSAHICQQYLTFPSSPAVTKEFSRRGWKAQDVGVAGPVCGNRWTHPSLPGCQRRRLPSRPAESRKAFGDQDRSTTSPWCPRITRDALPPTTSCPVGTTGEVAPSTGCTTGGRGGGGGIGVLKKKLNASRPCEHSTQAEKCQVIFLGCGFFFPLFSFGKGVFWVVLFSSRPCFSYHV